MSGLLANKLRRELDVADIAELLPQLLRGAAVVEDNAVDFERIEFACAEPIDSSPTCAIKSASRAA